MKQTHQAIQDDALYHNGKVAKGQIRTNKMSWMSSDQRGRGDMRDSWQWGGGGPRVILTAAPARTDFGKSKGGALPAAGTRSASTDAMLQPSFSGELGESGRLKLPRYPTSSYVRAHCSPLDLEANRDPYTSPVIPAYEWAVSLARLKESRRSFGESRGEDRYPQAYFPPSSRSSPVPKFQPSTEYRTQRSVGFRFIADRHKPDPAIHTVVVERTAGSGGTRRKVEAEYSLEVPPNSFKTRDMTMSFSEAPYKTEDAFTSRSGLTATSGNGPWRR